MSEDISGRRIVICGAAGGIGADTVRGFADRGVRIAAVYNNTPPPEDLLAKASWYKCDVSKKADVDALFDTVAKDLGGIDALIQPAGTWRTSLPEEADEGQIDLLMSANFKTTVLTNQAAFRHMKDKGGKIVNFGSVEGVQGRAASAVYAATRAAVQAWTRSVARGWGKYNINVNAIAPIMHTALYEYARSQMDAEALAALDKSTAELIPLGGKFGNPLQDCVPVLAFLVSDSARFITGQLIAVDGGRMMLGA